ncbi:MBL fold metallo-hydrolase [Streptomyces sp. NPDC004629]|uniref:MBL fold metallo-hydrolase n=1 Tax=Streptomyces sp. NPDC004629 TaxID=3364705 RepID=UPI00368DA818
MNVYAIEDDDGVALVDAGWAVAAAREALDKSLASIGYAPSEVTRIVVTHAHIDHYTLAVRLRQQFGTQVNVGRGERESLEWLAGKGPRHQRQTALLVAAGAAGLVGALPQHDERTDPRDEGWELPDVWLGESQLRIGRRTLQVLETPGHTKGHIMLLSPEEGLLFTGDQILPHITPSIGFEAVPQPQPLLSFLDSLARLRVLPDLRVLPAHGPDEARTHARIDELIQHHDERLARTSAIVEHLGSASTAAVAELLTWTRRGRRFDQLDDFNRMLAVVETQAHLACLVHRGTLTMAGDAVWEYRPV